MSGFVLSLCDRTGNMVQPWLDAGYYAITVDLQQPTNEHARRHHIVADIKTWRCPLRYGRPVAVFAFPPCDHLAISGARWFRDKGLRSLIGGLELVDACREICEGSGAPWMLENPVSMLASYWRAPDYIFDPNDYGDPYIKRTCLWVGAGFAMPPLIKPGDMFEEATWVEPSEGSIMHMMADSKGRAERRSITSAGFARAVYRANTPTPP